MREPDGMRRRRPLTTVLVATVMAATLVAATSSLAGCTDTTAGARSGTGHDEVTPLTEPAAPDDVTPSGADPTSSGATDADAGGRVALDPPSEERATDDRSTGGIPATTADERNRAHAVASEVLDRYGVVLTELAADAAIDLDRFATRWSTVADPSSAFSRDMLHTLVTRSRDDQMVIQPGPAGRSYVHRPVQITTVDDDQIDFTWCGYSPGIGVHVVSGEVLDDAVGHASGTGRLVQADGRWLVDTLDQDHLVALPAGSDDPCATGGGR